MNRWQSRSLKILGVLVFLYIIAALTTRFATDKFIQPKIQAQTDLVKSYQANILADLKLLEANPIFVKSLRTKDAQGFISGHIPWEGAEAQSSSAPENKALLALQTDLPKYGSIEDIRRLSADPRLANVDVSWVGSLVDYDHWNLASAAIIRGKLEFAKGLAGIGRIGALAALPMPDFTLFRYAVFVRFLQLQKQGNPIAGLKLIRHASYLMQTTGTLVGAMSAVAILGTEKTAVESFGVTDWKPIEKERLAAFKRVSWAWGGLMHLADWDQFPAEFLTYMKPVNGVCAMVNERAMGLGMQEFLAPKAPLESDFSNQLKQSAEWNQKLFTLCSMPQYQFLLEPPPETVKPTLMARIPFVRRAFGLAMMVATTPSYLRQYEAPTATSAGQ